MFQFTMKTAILLLVMVAVANSKLFFIIQTTPTKIAVIVATGYRQAALGFYDSKN
jgi:hypothetical protein